MSFEGRLIVVGDPSTQIIVCSIDFDREHQQRQNAKMQATGQRFKYESPSPLLVFPAIMM
jgi:hypothetical protein